MSETTWEARLRSEYAAVYTELLPGCWMSARELAEILVRRAQTARGLSLHQRTARVPLRNCISYGGLRWPPMERG